MNAGLLFLIILLIGMVWLNRGILGFGTSKCSWMSADKPNDDGSMKWMCTTHGTVVETSDGNRPPDCNV